MKRKSLDLSKLELNREIISNLTNEEMNFVNGGDVGNVDGNPEQLWGTRLLCFTSKAANCTDGSCPKTHNFPSVVIACFNL
jgi:hypothetical protein